MVSSGEQLGSQARVIHGAVFGDGLPVLLSAGLVVLVQAFDVLEARRWFRWPLADCLVASPAAVGAPCTALALAGSLSVPSSFRCQWQSDSWDICLVLMSAWRCPPLLNGLIA